MLPLTWSSVLESCCLESSYMQNVTQQHRLDELVDAWEVEPQNATCPFRVTEQLSMQFMHCINIPL